MRRLLPRVLELLCAALFLYAGCTKAWDPASFARSIENYQLLPAWPSALMALYLPWLEMIAAGALIVGKTRQAALSILCGLCLVFVIALSTAWIRGLDIQCGCFGENSSTVVAALIRAALLGGLLFWLLIRETRGDKTACPRVQHPAASP